MEMKSKMYLDNQNPFSIRATISISSLMHRCEKELIENPKMLTPQLPLSDDRGMHYEISRPKQK